LTERTLLTDAERAAVIEEVRWDDGEDAAVRALIEERWAGKAVNPVLGDVVLDGRTVHSSLGHGRANPYKRAAFTVVKDVLERGVLVHNAPAGTFWFSDTKAQAETYGSGQLVEAFLNIRNPKVKDFGGLNYDGEIIKIVWRNVGAGNSWRKNHFSD
jgi:hypothetical protein